MFVILKSIARPILLGRERRSLVHWMRGSNGRFIDTEGNNATTAIFSFFRLFAPSSAYRTVGDNTKLAQLPQAYTSQPKSPTPQYALSLPPNKSSSKYSIPMHVPGQQNFLVPTMSPPRPAAPPSYALPPSLNPPTKVPLLPGAGLGLDPGTIVRPCSAPRSVSTNSIHPPAPFFPTPSQAVVCESDSAAALGPTRRIFSVERQAGDSTGTGLSGSEESDSLFTSRDGDSQVPGIYTTGSCIWEEQTTKGVSATESRSLTEDPCSPLGEIHLGRLLFPGKKRYHMSCPRLGRFSLFATYCITFLSESMRLVIRLTISYQS